MQEGQKNIQLNVEIQGGFDVTNSFESEIRQMMRELRSLKILLDRMGIHIRMDWITSVANRFADALS